MSLPPVLVSWQAPAEVPVLADYDVLVIGSGSAGVCAALAAARGGARTAIVEAAPTLGGTAATGLPLLTTNDYKGTQLSFGILEEIMDALRKESAFEGDLAKGVYFCYDVDKYRLVVTRMLQEAGVAIWTLTRLVGVDTAESNIRHAIVHMKEGFRALAARAFVDCSGDADLAQLCGEPMLGNDCDGKPQPPTLLFFVAGVREAELDWPAIQKLWDQLRAEKNWINPRQGPALSSPFYYPGKPGFVGLNVTRSLGIDATKTTDLVKMEIEQREQVNEFFYSFLKPHVPAFRDAYMTGTAPSAGIRETRRIAGRFVLTGQDIIDRIAFPDAVAWSAYPIDRHSPLTGTTDLRVKDSYRPGFYSVPFRVMIPQRTRNLLVSGRCVSADELAFSAIRVMGTTMPLGAAAGLAAVQMAHKGVTNAEVDVDSVRAELAAKGALVT